MTTIELFSNYSGDTDYDNDENKYVWFHQPLHDIVIINNIKHY